MKSNYFMHESSYVDAGVEIGDYAMVVGISVKWYVEYVNVV